MSITAYKLVTADSAYPDALTDAVSKAIEAGWQPFGQPMAFNGKLVQAVIEGVPDGAGGAPVDLQIADVSGLQAALDGKASTQALTDGLATKLATTGTAAAATKLASAHLIA